MGDEADDLAQAAQRGNPSFVWRAGQERRMALVRRYVPLADQRVLDVGCGIGMYTADFARHTQHAFGVEIEADRAHRAQQEIPRIAQAVGETLPFVNACFDLVFSHEVLEHVADDRRCAEEMIRVTRPGGHLVIFVPNRLYFFETHGLYWRGTYHFGNKPLINWLPNAVRDRLAPHVRAYTSRSLKELFADQPVRTIIHTQIYPGYDNIVAARPRLGRLLQRITYTLERTPLRQLGLSHLLILQVTAPSR